MEKDLNKYAICEKIEAHFRGKRIIALKEVVQTKMETIFPQYDTFQVAYVNATYFAESSNRYAYFKVSVITDKNVEMCFTYDCSDLSVMSAIQKQFADVKEIVHFFELHRDLYTNNKSNDSNEN